MSVSSATDDDHKEGGERERGEGERGEGERGGGRGGEGGRELVGGGLYLGSTEAHWAGAWTQRFLEPWYGH